jgi:hypothetical protein
MLLTEEARQLRQELEWVRAGEELRELRELQEVTQRLVERHDSARRHRGRRWLRRLLHLANTSSQTAGSGATAGSGPVAVSPLRKGAGSVPARRPALLPSEDTLFPSEDTLVATRGSVSMATGPPNPPQEGCPK